MKIILFILGVITAVLFLGFVLFILWLDDLTNIKKKQTFEDFTGRKKKWWQ